MYRKITVAGIGWSIHDRSGGAILIRQKTLAVMHTKRRYITVELVPRYWAIGLAFGTKNYHVHLGPIGISLSKKTY